MCWNVLGVPGLGSAVRPRVGVLGSGSLARDRAIALAHSGAGEIAAVVGGESEAAALAGDLGGGAVVGRSLEDLVDAGAAGVILTAPTAMQELLATEALERGLAVFCRSPLGRTAEEAGRIVDASRRADRLLMVDCPLRSAPGMRRIRELVARGAFGDVYEVDLTYRVASGPAAGSWLNDPVLAGGGCLMELGTQLVDLALWTLGYPEVVGASGRLFAGGRAWCGRASGRGSGGTAEDAVAATLDVCGGATVRLGCAWGTHAGCGARVCAEFHGTRGGVMLASVGGGLEEFRAQRFTGAAAHELDGIDRGSARTSGEWAGQGVIRWAQRLRDGQTGFDAGCKRAAEVAAAIDRVYDRRAATLHPGCIEVGTAP